MLNEFHMRYLTNILQHSGKFSIILHTCSSFIFIRFSFSFLSFQLFKLQKSYRGDSRFQLDERFAENDDESEDDENDARKHSGIYSSDSELEATNDDDISKQLSREKDLSMSVLRGILGHNIGTKYGESSLVKERFT